MKFLTILISIFVILLTLICCAAGVGPFLGAIIGFVIVGGIGIFVGGGVGVAFGGDAFNGAWIIGGVLGLIGALIGGFAGAFLFN